MTFTGSIASINTVLDRLLYAPDPDCCGDDGLTIIVNDMGHPGSGGAHGEEATAYGRLLGPGLAGLRSQLDAHPNLLAQLGCRLEGSYDPWAPTWTRIAAGPNSAWIHTDSPDADEYAGTFSVLTAGTHDYVLRFSSDAGGTWLCCDNDWTGDHQACNAAKLVVAP